MTKAYRAEVREHLKNCVGARFSAEALVIALAGGRIGQGDWSVECDRIISLLDDDDDYRRGFEDGLKANTRAAFAAAKQTIPDRTCERIVHGLERDREVATVSWTCSECGAHIGRDYRYCPMCGERLVGE